MVYRKFGKTGIEMSTLGFGAMRLPMTEVDGKRVVDYEKATEMIHRAFDLGVNYIDTAPFYCEADSEVAVGKALKGYRDKVYVSTKNPVDDKDTPDSFLEKLQGSLTKLDVDYIDFYHFWGIGLETFRNKIMAGGLMDAALKAKEQGLIKHISFSYHDKPENMKEIIDSGYFSSVLMQYNLLDRSNESNVAYANEKGLGVVIMGPVGGGRLGKPSAVIQNLVGKSVDSSAEMALRFVLANENVSVALSGMSELFMVDENAAIASIEGHLTKEEREVVNKMLEENKRLSELYCTDCKYCMPCPQQINIPHVFGLMNYHKVYGLTDHAKNEYAKLKTPIDSRIAWEKGNGLDQSVCIECGECESKCPQKLSIIQQLKETAEVLG